MLLPADTGLAFTHDFDTFAYEGCHMEMLGIAKRGAAALLTWHDPYVKARTKSVLPAEGRFKGRQVLSPSLELRQSANSFQLHLLGNGNHITIAQAYREIAREKGRLVTWKEKLKGHPERAKLFGAINYKLWSILTRRMNDKSNQELSVRVNWTFDEAAQIAEHLKNDLKLEKVLFLMGGWIHRGYDNQHPDILPAAPECGGNEGLSDCARRVRKLGYHFGLHDNYQDMYRDSPSWDESYLTKHRDGSLAQGGKWGGGRAYLTCSRKAVELARRPQNLPAVKELVGDCAYFIDTTFAAGLTECFDPKHRLTRWDDMRWKQAISDYARELFGMFGSECGREWAIPHSDFFEGLTGVSGQHYHNANLMTKVGGVAIPLFEMVYRDCIAAYGKYGYDPAKAADYVLHHISIGRPLHYHNIPQHLYWKEPGPKKQTPMPLRPAIADLKQTAPDRFSVTYQWSVKETPPTNWRVFVHFTDQAGNIKFQNDHAPTTRWQPGEVRQGPFEVIVPTGLTGIFEIRMGLFRSLNGSRAALEGPLDGESRCRVGRVKIDSDKITFQPLEQSPVQNQMDPAVFTHADQGWAEDLHPLDRFVKNTYEILSPLNELTSQSTMTEFEFLTSDYKVRRSLFGEGSDALAVVVNADHLPYLYKSQSGEEIELPPFGFLIESPVFVAFHALNWNGLHYDEPAFFTLRSLDAQPLSRSKRIRVYHGFGDTRLKLKGTMRNVAKEIMIEGP
jgi:hypothetical protein